jgi:hypothetical protein
VEHIVCPFLQKGCKMSYYVRSSKSRKYAKEANYIYYQKIISLISGGNTQSSISLFL